MRELTLLIPDAQYARLCDSGERRAALAELNWLFDPGLRRVRLVWDSEQSGTIQNDSESDNGNGRITSLVEKLDFEPQRLTEAEVEGMACPLNG